MSTAAAAEREAALDALVEEIVELAGRPVDTWAVAALLESIGTRDLDARERFGLPDVFALAAVVQARIAQLEIPPWQLTDDPESELGWDGGGRSVARLYVRGVFFFVPLVLGLVVLLAFGYSQFASLDFTLAQATMVALAVSLSLVATAGTVQALGALGPVFDEPGKFHLTERMVWTVLAVGAALAMAGGLGAWALARLSGGWPADELRTGLVYYLLLCGLWITNAVLYQQRRYRIIIVASLAGLGVVALVHELTGVGIRSAQWAGLGATIVGQLAVIAVVLRRHARSTVGTTRLAVMPPLSLLARYTAPWFLYGILYFTFLQADRLIAWSWGDEPRPLWFHSDYELAVDWALLAAVFGIGMLEQTMERFSATVFPAGEHYAVGAQDEHNRLVARMFVRRLRSVALMSLAGGVAVAGGAVLLHAIGALGVADELYGEPHVRRIFLAAFAGYALLTMGLALSASFNALGRGWLAAACMALGALADVAGALLGASLWGYRGSVLGLLAGGLVFFLASAVAARHVLRRADFYAYAAF